MQPTSLRFGRCKKPCCWYCFPLFSVRLPLWALWRLDRWFIAILPTLHESESRMSDIRSAAYFSAYGADARLFPNRPGCGSIAP